ncbi:MAG: beta-ketoacyl-ACP synthase II [Myxococcota bacterium]|nr:beta-ketoacyl-ACP synthase II [Myxococcota bacterium]
MRRVVVTGLGLVTPLASGVAETWKRLTEGESGVGTAHGFDLEGLRSTVAAQLPTGEEPDAFQPERWLPEKQHSRVDPFILYGIAAAKQAIEDAGWTPESDHARERTGVALGSGIGGLQRIANTTRTLDSRGPRRVSPFFVPGTLINLTAGHISIEYGFGGPNHAVSTACSSGSHAIGDSARMIQLGDADVMVTGGSEAAVCRLAMAGFSAAKALSTGFNDQPSRASRPWDRDRDGFVIGEGAGALILEEYEHAKARGARIYCEIKGYGMSGDAHHITAPPEDGRGAFRAMQRALETAGLNPEDIDYINAHGTSTPLGDLVELRAIKRLFGENPESLAVSSTKSAIGHLLGAAGSVEAVFSVLSLQHQIAPPTRNLDNPDEGCDLNLVPHQSQDLAIKHALSNSFGFGGTNAALVFSELKG